MARREEFTGKEGAILDAENRQHPAMNIPSGFINVNTKALEEFQALCEEMNTTNVAVLQLLLLHLQRGAVDRTSYLESIRERYSNAARLLRDVIKSLSSICEEAMEECRTTKSSTAQGSATTIGTPRLKASG
jgi:hypothetical protein